MSNGISHDKVVEHATVAIFGNGETRPKTSKIASVLNLIQTNKVKKERQTKKNPK